MQCCVAKNMSVGKVIKKIEDYNKVRKHLVTPLLLQVRK